jgi:hypothetical protein
VVLTETKRVPASTVLSKGYAVHHSGIQGVAGVAVLVSREWTRAAAVRGVRVPPACEGYVAHVQLQRAPTCCTMHILGVYMPCDPERWDGREAAYAYLAEVLAGAGPDDTIIIATGMRACTRATGWVRPMPTTPLTGGGWRGGLGSAACMARAYRRPPGG